MAKEETSHLTMEVTTEHLDDGTTRVNQVVTVEGSIKGLLLGLCAGVKDALEDADIPMEDFITALQFLNYHSEERVVMETGAIEEAMENLKEEDDG